MYRMSFTLLTFRGTSATTAWVSAATWLLNDVDPSAPSIDSGVIIEGSERMVILHGLIDSLTHAKGTRRFHCRVTLIISSCLTELQPSRGIFREYVPLTTQARSTGTFPVSSVIDELFQLLTLILNDIIFVGRRQQGFQMPTAPESFQIEGFGVAGNTHTELKHVFGLIRSSSLIDCFDDRL